MERQRQFASFEVVAQVLGVSVKKLRASLNVRSGEIRLGGTVPPIQTLKLGHLRMVPLLVLHQWLQDVGAAQRPETPRQQPVEVSAQSAAQDQQRRGRGRPRKALMTTVGAR